MGPPSMESGRFLPIKIREGGSHFGKDTYSSFYVTTFPNGPLLGVPSYSIEGGVTDSCENIYLYHGIPVGSFAW